LLLFSFIGQVATIMLSRGLVFLMGLVAILFGIAISAPAALAQESTEAAKAEVATTAEVAADPAHDAEHDDASHDAAHAAGADHAHGEHHADPTMGNGENLGSLMAWRADKSIFTALVFLIMCAVLFFVAWKPITEALQKREKMIANNIADAKAASEQALAKLKEYEAKLAGAATQASEVVSQARKDAEAAGQRIITASQEEAARQRDRALADIESAKQTALSEMASKSTDMAFGLARRVVGRELNTNDHQQLIQDAISKMPSRN
jgi:F-type H+-transporting ATPase subunit b